MKKIFWKLFIRRIFHRICYIFYFREPAIWQYESCERCDHCFRLCWSAKNEKWIEVYGNNSGCLCIDCFIELANKKEIILEKSDIERIELFNPKE